MPALAWTEALTRLPDGGVPDDLYERVSNQFSGKKLAGVAFRSVPGSADKLFGLERAGLN